MGSKPKQSAASKELELISIEREKKLRVENAKQTTKTFSENTAFRKKLRGVFALLSGGFQGFPSALGVGSSRGGGGGGGGSQGARSGGSGSKSIGGGRSGAGGAITTTTSSRGRPSPTIGGRR